MTSDDGVIVEADGSGSVTASHFWYEPGTYTVMLFVVDDDTRQGLAEWTVVVSSPEDAIDSVDEYIQDLSDTAFGKNPNVVLNRKDAMHGMLTDIKEMINEEHYNGALKSLLNSFRTKMDGLPQKGSDWIITPVDQGNLCMMVDALAEYITLMR